MIRYQRIANKAVAIAFTIVIATVSAARAGTLEVTPILIDVIATGSSASVITVKNRASNPANVQIRVMRWRQIGGTDVLDRTDAVAVSPPFAALSPNADYAIRIVRTDQRPIVGEENYRLVIDELPTPRQPDGTVTLAIRYSIPVFFRSPKARAGELMWSARRQGDSLSLVATNHGERRVRVSNLRLVDGSGTSVSFGAGLAGYALGETERSWIVKNATGSLSLKDAHVVFISEAGPQTAVVHVQPAPQAGSPAPSS